MKTTLPAWAVILALVSLLVSSARAQPASLAIAFDLLFPRTNLVSVTDPGYENNSVTNPLSWLGGNVAFWLNANASSRIKQDGYSDTVTVYYSSNYSQVSAFYIQFWRDEGFSNKWQLVYSENVWPKISNTCGRVTVTLSNAVALKAWDAVALGYTGTSVPTAFVQFEALSAGGASYWENTYVPLTNGVPWLSYTENGGHSPVHVWMRAPVAVAIGDSIVGGSPIEYSMVYDGFRAFTNKCAWIWDLGAIWAAPVQKAAWLAGSTVITEVVQAWQTNVLNMKPRIVFIGCGVNDLAAYPDDVSHWLTNMLWLIQSARSNDIKVVPLQIWPWSNGSSNNMWLRDNVWNPGLVQLCATNGDTVIACPNLDAWLGANRAGGTPGNLWNIKPEYDLGGVHYNTAGEHAAAVALFNLLTPPNVQAFWQTNGVFNFTYVAVSNLTYQVQYMADLASTNWTNLGGPITATNGTVSASDSIGPNVQRFYRVLLLQ